MRITVDTNVLVRAVVQDDLAQAKSAVKALKGAELIAIALPCFCEFVWVLAKVYSFSVGDIASALRALVNAENVETNRAAVETGLSFLEAGGDFADGVIAFEGSWLGGEAFLSFDKQAVRIAQSNGLRARLL